MDYKYGGFDSKSITYFPFGRTQLATTSKHVGLNYKNEATMDVKHILFSKESDICSREILKESHVTKNLDTGDMRVSKQDYSTGKDVTYDVNA